MGTAILFPYFHKSRALQPIEKTHWRDMLEAEGKNEIKNQAMSDLLQPSAMVQNKLRQQRSNTFFYYYNGLRRNLKQRAIGNQRFGKIIE
jgi:hypothetical protein